MRYAAVETRGGHVLATFETLDQALNFITFGESIIEHEGLEPGDHVSAREIERTKVPALRLITIHEPEGIYSDWRNEA